jgi:hypothetical protein
MFEKLLFTRDKDLLTKKQARRDSRDTDQLVIDDDTICGHEFWQSLGIARWQ